MSNAIKVPDVLPNNMRQLRVMQDLSINELADALSLNHSYISILETFKANMSGLTALNIMTLLDANFTQFFDIKEKIKLPYTIEEKSNITTTLELKKEYMNESDKMNVINIEKALDKHLKKNKIKGKVLEYKIKKTEEISDPCVLKTTLDVVLLEEVQVERKFDINFSQNTDTILFENLHYKGFGEEKEVTLDSSDYMIIDNKLHVTNTDKLLEIGKPYYSKKPIINIDNVTFINNEKDKQGAIKFNFLFNSMTNIKYIQGYMDVSDKEVYSALGISKNYYHNLIKGNKKISTKLMWRMCMYFNVPLEQILNIPLYLEKFN